MKSMFPFKCKALKVNPLNSSQAACYLYL